MTTSHNYEALFSEALADVESGVQHPCGTVEHCCEMGGCPRCFQGVLRGNIGIERIDVFASSGILRITTTGDHRGPNRCVVSFRNVPVTVHRNGTTPNNRLRRIR